MSATVEEVTALADVSKFLLEMEEESTLGQCHTALTWLSLQIKKAGILDYNIHLCVGKFAGYDHSWLQIEDVETEKHTLIDMTVNQFGEYDVPYVGPMSPGYVICDSISLCDNELT